MSKSNHNITNPRSPEGRQAMREAADDLQKRYGMTDAGRDQLLREAVEETGGDPASIQQKATRPDEESGSVLDGKVEEFRRELQAELEASSTVERDSLGRPKSKLQSAEVDDLGREKGGR